jgi:site-specific recombinase XerD
MFFSNIRPVKKSQSKASSRHLEFPKAFKSFMGYLEGTQKAAHTIKNYRLDLLAFQSFLSDGDEKKAMRCENLGEADLARYHEFLGTQGLKTNTRRRKLLTAHRFVRYLSQRNQLVVTLPSRLPAPHKIERVPFTVPREQLIQAVRALTVESVLERRNRALLWTLAETGCQVSELTQLRFENWTSGRGGCQVSITGKAARELPVSQNLFDEIESLKEASREKKWLFLGFNKHGPLGTPISSRGVELLVRHYSVRLGISQLTPRTFRHSAVVAWFQEGLTQNEIQKRLGLRTAYAFRSYASLVSQD